MVSACTLISMLVCSGDSSRANDHTQTELIFNYLKEK